MNKFILFFLLIGASFKANAQQIIPLYNGAIPGAIVAPQAYQEETVTGDDGVVRIAKVTSPSLYAYFPAKPNGTAVIICPGGGYGILAFDKEGINIAKKFNALGITAFVLKYRLPSDLIMVDKSYGPLQDALQAMYLVRKNAANWNLDAQKIGVVGFSAGGHLAASLSVHYNDVKINNQEQINLKPNFSILVYPVISFGTITHAGSVKNLLGDNPTAAQKQFFSNQNYVNEFTPPTFLVHASNDATVVVRNSTIYHEALVKNKVPTEMHIYQTGGHGFGLANDWFDRLKTWLQLNKWL